MFKRNIKDTRTTLFTSLALNIFQTFSPCLHCWLWAWICLLGRVFLVSIFSSLQKQPPEVFLKKRVFINFAKFTRKHLCQCLFLNKFAEKPANLLKKRLCCFLGNPVKFLRAPLSTEHLGATASVFRPFEGESSRL